jgi:hypothetical protein
LSIPNKEVGKDGVWLAVTAGIDLLDWDV